MGSLIVLLIIAGCAAYQYFKGTLVKSFAILIIAICASVVAFGYFELVSGIFISKAGNSKYPGLVPWAQPLSFVLLFVLAFAIMQTVVGQFTKKAVDLGALPEMIGRVVCGIFLGLTVSGLLLTTAAMSPLANEWPYPRFDESRPDVEKPVTVLLNVDGYATGWFGMLSNGSFSGKQSFATLHPDFLDQLALNRLGNVAENISLVTTSDAIVMPSKKDKMVAFWPAPQELTSSDGRAPAQKTGCELTIVRFGINKSSVKEAGRFTLSQVRLICKEKGGDKGAMSGKAQNVYPIGYLTTATQLQEKGLSDEMKITNKDYPGKSKVRWLDFAFHVPQDSVPVLLEFKQNNIVQIPQPGKEFEAPTALSFIPASKCATKTAKVKGGVSGKVSGVELAGLSDFIGGIKLEIRDPNHWKRCEDNRSISPAQFDDDKITFVRAAIVIVEPLKKPEPEPVRRPGRRRRRKKEEEEDFKSLTEMLKPLEGYKWLSLKCEVTGGSAISGEQLPVLTDLSGRVHHSAGVVALGKIGGEDVYEVDYSSLTSEEINGGLVIAGDDTVAKPFPDTVWLPQAASEIELFYVLYAIKSGEDTIITGVRPGDSQVSAGFNDYEGFLVK